MGGEVNHDCWDHVVEAEVLFVLLDLGISVMSKDPASLLCFDCI